MYFYIDESGQTGLELFDDNQPFLYYGVLSSKFNLDELCLPHVESGLVYSIIGHELWV